MRLAEALIERKALKEKLERVRARLAENARVQEGDKPAEDPRALLAQADELVRGLRALTIRINKTNLAAPLGTNGDSTLMHAIAERDMLALKRSVLETAANAATVTRERGFAITRSEIKFRPTVDIAALQKEIDALAKQYRELDTKIQTRNFEVELVE